MGTIDIIDIKPLNEIKDPTWGTGVMHKRLSLVAVKLSGAISDGEAHALMNKAWPRNRDCGGRVLSAVDANGIGLMLIYEMYVVKDLGFFPRLCHTLRMFAAAITGNTSLKTVKVITLK